MARISTHIFIVICWISEKLPRRNLKLKRGDWYEENEHIIGYDTSIVGECRVLKRYTGI